MGWEVVRKRRAAGEAEILLCLGLRACRETLRAESGERRAESDGGDRVCTKSTAVLFLFVPLIVDQDLTS